jgi:hypothetical protein
MAEKRLLHTPIDITAQGETISILPFGFGQQPRVMAKLAPLFTTFQAASAGDAVSLGDIFEAGGEGLMEVLAIAAKKPREWLDTLDYDEGKALANAVFEANKDTLVKKLLPDLMALMAGKAPAQTVPAA